MENKKRAEIRSKRKKNHYHRIKYIIRSNGYHLKIMLFPILKPYYQHEIDSKFSIDTFYRQLLIPKSPKKTNHF